MKGINSFQSFNDKNSQNYLADHYPEGKLTGKKLDSNSLMYRFILSISIFIKVVVGDLLILVRNWDILQAEELLTEYETSVKIPLDLPRLETLVERRNAVKCLISKIPVYNFDNGVVDKSTTYENYIKCLTGLDVTLRGARVVGNDSRFPLTFPFAFGSSSASNSFVFIVSVPVPGSFANNFFPLKFIISFFNPKIPDATQELLDLVLDRVVPSFCRWEYEAIIP